MERIFLYEPVGDGQRMDVERTQYSCSARVGIVVLAEQDQVSMGPDVSVVENLPLQLIFGGGAPA